MREWKGEGEEVAGEKMKQEMWDGLPQQEQQEVRN